MSRTLLLLSCVVASLCPLSGASAAAPGEEPVPVYRCLLNVRVPEGGSGTLDAHKSFREDGSVHSMWVDWEDGESGLAREAKPNARVSVSFSWRSDAGQKPFDWASGSIAVTHHVYGPGSAPLRGEEWSQIVVDRNQSARTYDRDGMKLVYLPGGDVRLTGDLEPPNFVYRLRSPIDSLLAWGSGAGRVTVYETLVTRRKRARDSYPVSPVQRQRIVGSYDLDIAAIAAAAAQVREAGQRWEAGLAGKWRECEHKTEGGDIIVTDARPRSDQQGSNQ